VARLAEDIERERRRREAGRKRGVVEYSTQIEALCAALSPRQRQLHEDKSTAICVVCTRQSGKTSEALLRIVETFFGKARSITYVCLPTRDRARDAFWDRWKELSALFGLTDEHHHETLLETRGFNGSVVRFVGVPDQKRANRVRSQTLDLLIIDEAANFADDVLQYLIENCAQAALGIKNGTLYVCSTPGMEPAGYLYRLYTDKQLEFSRHFLSLQDNPAWTDPESYLAKVRRQFGYSDSDPTYQREWLGKWVADFNLRVYRVTDDNCIDTAPACDFHVMAVDLGATDESAICVLGWQANKRTLYCVHEEAEGELDITSVADRVRELQAKYQPLATMVDGAAKQSVLELQNRHGIALEATPKAPGYKAPAIKQLNADFRRQSVMVPRSFSVVGQMRALQWHPKAIGMKENPGQPNDRCDAFLYAYLKAYHYVEQIKADEPEPGTDAWFERERQLIREAHELRSAPKDPHDVWDEPSSLDPWE
jgi:phage terminase large subunit